LGDEIEIRSGITAGQKVVVRGAFQLDAQRLKSIGDTALFTHPTEEGHEEHEHEEGKSTNNQLLSPQLLILVSIAFVLGAVITAMIQKRHPFMVAPTKAKLEPKVPDTEKRANA
jgi:hypothetical protein